VQKDDETLALETVKLLDQTIDRGWRVIYNVIEFTEKPGMIL